jgi:hypothetical protein
MVSVSAVPLVALRGADSFAASVLADNRAQKPI